MPRWTVRLPDAISNLVNGAPAALDTLNELAIALQDNDSEIASLVTSVSEKLAKSANLSDLADAAVARTSLGLDDMAQQNAGARGNYRRHHQWRNPGRGQLLRWLVFSSGAQRRRVLYRRISRKGSSPSIRLMASSMPMCRGRWLSLVVCRLLRMRRPMAGQYVRQDNGWQPAAAGGGDWTLLATGNFPAGNAEYVFPVTFTSEYSLYKVMLLNVACDGSSNTQMELLASSDGSTWQTGSFDYKYRFNDTTQSSSFDHH